MKTFSLLLFPIFLLAQEVKEIDLLLESQGYDLHYHKEDRHFEQIRNYVEFGLEESSQALNRKFKKQVEVYLFPDRSLLDQAWQKAWNMPSFQSQCWMVGSGVESRLDLLSPLVWKTQACEHDPADHEEIKMLVHHELVHVLHSDYNRSPSFTEINNIDWFVEGLATYISGQLDQERLSETIAYVQESGGPSELSKFWTGQHKYGLAGSMVSFIDKTHGRTVLSQLMVYNDVDDILDRLETTEEALVKSWREDLLRGN